MNIIITGITGRMGREVALAALAHEHITISGATARDPSLLDQDIGKALAISPTGVSINAIEKIDFSHADAVIDFTLPELLPELLKRCNTAKTALITGTTGVSSELQKQVSDAAQQITIVQSFNMSLGVNLLAALVEKASASLDENFDIEINELHHRHKKDAPSGTAILLGHSAANARDQKLEDVQVIDRNGLRKTGDIGFSVQRGGGVIGDHTVMLAGENERLELTHRGHNRRIYADGALKAAQWAKNKPSGLYSMRDVLGV